MRPFHPLYPVTTRQDEERSDEFRSQPRGEHVPSSNLIARSLASLGLPWKGIAWLEPC